MKIKTFKNNIVALMVVVLMASQVSFLPVFARNIQPYNAIRHNPLGVYIPPKHFVVYESDNEHAPVLEVIDVSDYGVESKPSMLGFKQVFKAFSDDSMQGVMMVLDETDDYCKVMYDLESGKTGWIKKSEGGEFLTYPKFLNVYGRKYGISVLYSKDYKPVLYNNPSEDSTKVGQKCYEMKDGSLQMLLGNWMLVKMADFEGSACIGWLKWRDSIGNIYVFPKISE